MAGEIEAKVAVGCDMFYMAKNLENTAEGAKYDTPFNLPINAVTNDSAEEKGTYYFDNHKNDVIVAGNGDEELGLVSSFIPLEKLAPIIGQIYENGAMLVGAKSKALYACMWRTELSDGKHRYHCAMLVDFTRPANNANTKEGTNANMLELTGSVYFTVREWALSDGTKKSFMYTQMDEGAIEGVDLDSEWFKEVPTPERIAKFVPETQTFEVTLGEETIEEATSALFSETSTAHLTLKNAGATVFDKDVSFTADEDGKGFYATAISLTGDEENPDLTIMFNSVDGTNFKANSMLWYPNTTVEGYSAKLVVKY